MTTEVTLQLWQVLVFVLGIVGTTGVGFWGILRFVDKVVNGIQNDPAHLRALELAAASIPQEAYDKAFTIFDKLGQVLDRVVPEVTAVVEDIADLGLEVFDGIPAESKAK